MYVFISMVCLVLFRVYSSRHPLPLMGKPCTHFPAWGKLFNGAYHAVRLSVMRVCGHLLGSLDFLGHRKSWPRRKLCRVFMFRKNKQNNKSVPRSLGFFSFQANLRGAKSRLTLMTALFPPGKILCPWCSFPHLFPWWKIKYLAPTFLQWEKTFSLVLKKTLLLTVSYSYSMFLFGSKC